MARVAAPNAHPGQFGIGPQAAPAEADLAQRRFALLGEASLLLGSSLDYQATLLAAARLAVPCLAGWCVVYLAGEDRHVRTAVTCHEDPRKERSLNLLDACYPLDPTDPNPVVRTVSSGRAEFYPTVPDGLAGALTAGDEQKARLKEIGLCSYICVPLIARGRILGAIALARGQAGHPFGTFDLALAEDLAGRAALAIENARLYQEARDAIRVRDEFLASASHELRTPVTAVRAFAQMLQRRLANGGSIDTGDLFEALGCIESNASRLSAQINELLDLSCLRSGRPVELCRDQIDLIPLLNRVVESQRLLSGRHAIRIESGFSRLCGFWDGPRLERVISNLVSNAVKYSPLGGEIEIRLTTEGDVAVLSVHDQGIGIPEPDLPHVFETFFRATNVPARAYGTGIGLTGVHEILRLHGGTIGISSSEGEGTVCTVRLPGCAHTAESRTPAGPAQAVADSSSSTTSCTV